MSFEFIGPLLQSVVGDKTTRENHFVLAGKKIWVFSQTHHRQETFNWGHNVTYMGGYAVAFDTEDQKWGDVHEFERVHSDENTEELVFALGDDIYLLLLTNFAAVAFQKLFKWQGNAWTEVDLQIPEPITTEWNQARVTATIADDTSFTDRFIVVNMESKMRLFKLHVDGSGASIEYVDEVPDEVNRLRGQATSAVNLENRIIISFLVHGCGARWESQRFIVFDKNSKTFEEIYLTDETGPSFCFAGAWAHALTPSGEWLHATGSVQVGMCDSRFDDSVWALTNLNGEPKWEQKSITAPAEGATVIDSSSGDIFYLGDEGVAKSSLL